MIDYELLPYHRYGIGKYEYLGKVYELEDYESPSPELLAHLRGIIDEAFGRRRKRNKEHSLTTLLRDLSCILRLISDLNKLFRIADLD